MTGTKKKEANFGDWDRPPLLRAPNKDDLKRREDHLLTACCAAKH